MIYTVTPNPVLDRTLTVPKITFNEMTRATATRRDWGGKGFNVSRALQALGADNVALGFIGGETGQQLEHGLWELGIKTDLVRIAGETRINIVITETEGDRYVKVNEAGPTLQAAEITDFFALAQGRIRENDLWALCGSLPPGIPSDFYARLIKLIHEQGAKALLDTSGGPLLLGCHADPYLIKPNIPEAETLTGQTIHSIPTAAQATDFFLNEGGVTLVALSLGKDGLILASHQHKVWAKPPTIQARNPVGAGDALLAGLMWALAQNLQDLDDIARWGVASGTVAAAKEGVSVGNFAEVQAMCDNITLETP